MESLSFTSLLILCATAGTESEQVIERYGLKGKSFLLDVGGVKPAEFRRFYWKFNYTQIIVEYTLNNNYLDLFPQYKEKVMFYETNFSLRILKLEESNRGIYTAITQDIHGKEKKIVIYRLIPQDGRTEEKNRAKIIYAIPGSSLSLTVDIPGHLKMNMLEWMLKTENTEVTILKMATGGQTVFLYKNQVVFKETDYSLTLTNLSHGNSGIYTAVLSDEEDEKHRLNIYRVTVLEPSTFCIWP